MFVGGTVTLLSRYVLVHPHTMLAEAQQLNATIGDQGDCMERLRIDRKCFMITPLHQLVNRILETLRSAARTGTTGMGVGVCADDAFLAHPEFFPLGPQCFELDAATRSDLLLQQEQQQVPPVTVPVASSVTVSAEPSVTVPVPDVSSVAVPVALLPPPPPTVLRIEHLLDRNQLLTVLRQLYVEKRDAVRTILGHYKAGRLHKIFDVNYLQLHPGVEFNQECFDRANHLFLEFLSKHTVASLSKFYSEFAEKYHQCFVDGTELLNQRLELQENVIFEGAQGSMLDRIYGTYPHLTRTLCSEDNAMSLLSQVQHPFKLVKIGALRCYS